ncbi:nuclease [Sphingobium sp.]|uniref:nuclease n=1 Tax=Sphingobium sp. TaxID=1912891 RepID=UPI002D1861BD|nr:nuclease [Sphingobium sp.]HUD95866.1 nuclease [Sphingobium sp.]
MRSLALAAALVLLSATTPTTAFAWGGTAHSVIDRAAIEAIPDDGPIFLRKHVDYIAASASLPDSWRGDSENFSKIEEDPNHGWFREQFTFLKPIPRSRYEFVIALYKRYEAIKEGDPATAARTNVRWTGTLPYAAIEAYDRLVVCMRYVRKAQAEGGDVSVPEQHCAFQAIRLGHYIGDGAQPMHDSIHSDGWRGDNPKGFTTDRSVHGRFESQFVDGMKLTVADIAPRIGAPGHSSGDMFDAVLAFLDQAGDKVGTVYTLEKRNGFADFADRDVRAMVYERTAAGAAMLRDMLCRAWAESANPPAKVTPSPLDFGNSRFNPETGSAPD